MLNVTAIKSTSNKQETLFNAGKLIEQVIHRDQEYTDLANLISGPESYVKPILSSEEELIKTHTVKVPTIFTDKLAGLQCRCFMGLLPEIGRAWLTIDNRLYIWNLSDERDIMEYSDQDQIIITVGLVKPRPNVFGENIKYILAVSTPLQVILLAVSINNNNYTQPMQLYATNMSISSDDIQMTRITGTEDGRIFMIGHKDDNNGLYELEYWHPQKWAKNSNIICRTEPFLTKFLPTFTPKMLRPVNPPPVESIVIDSERKVLYILYEKSVIEVVYLGDAYSNYKSVYKHSSIIDSAYQMCYQQSKHCIKADLEIASIHVISQAESKKIHLMAITKTGIRLYFSHYRDSFRMMTTQTQTEPNTLELGFIRFPPPQKDNQPQFYAKSYYDCGISLSLIPHSEKVDHLVMTAVTSTAPETNPIAAPTTSLSLMINGNKPNYVESEIRIDAQGEKLEISETNREMVGKQYLKEVAQQLSDPPRQFMVMSTSHVDYYQKLRPVDTLYRLVSYTRGLQTDADLIASFFNRYGKVEACAMCLSIACSTDEEHIKARVSNMFFRFGGDPSATYSSQVTGNHLGRVIGPTDIHYSGKHDGFVLYFARIISPVWKMKMFSIRGNDVHDQLCFAQSQRTLYNTKMKLLRLKFFMDANSHFHDSANISNPRFQVSDRNAVQLELTEQKSVRDLYLLLVQCIEAISFIEFILDSNIQVIINDYVHENPERFYNLDINTMLTTLQGKEMVRDLVVSTIAKYGSTLSSAGFDIVSKQYEKCNSFFSSSDIEFFKGVEYFNKAFNAESEYEKEDSYKQSLKHFKLATSEISDEKFAQICRSFLEYDFYFGIIELVLERAEKLDPQQEAVIAIEEPERSNEHHRTCFEKRTNAYKMIFCTLDKVFEKKERGIEINVYKAIFNSAIQSKDIVFHYQLYAWLMQKKAYEELLSVDTDYLIPYLEKHHIKNDQRASLEFLWRYYRIKERYEDTARCLEKLADLPNTKVEDRVNYLAQAVINGRCETIQQPHIVPYIEDLEKRLRWAQLQARIKHILSSLKEPEALQAAESLDQHLYSDVELEQLFAKKFPLIADIF